MILNSREKDFVKYKYVVRLLYLISLGFIPRPLGRKKRPAELWLNTLLSRETRKSSVKREGLPRGFLFFSNTFFITRLSWIELGLNAKDTN